MPSQLAAALQQMPAWQTIPSPQGMPPGSAVHENCVTSGRHFKQGLAGPLAPEGTHPPSMTQ